MDVEKLDGRRWETLTRARSTATEAVDFQKLQFLTYREREVISSSPLRDEDIHGICRWKLDENTSLQSTMSSVEPVEKAIDEDEPVNLNEEKEDGYATTADCVDRTDNSSDEGEEKAAALQTW